MFWLTHLNIETFLVCNATGDSLPLKIAGNVSWDLLGWKLSRYKSFLCCRQVHSRAPHPFFISLFRCLLPYFLRMFLPFFWKRRSLLQSAWNRQWNTYSLMGCSCSLEMTEYIRRCMGALSQVEESRIPQFSLPLCSLIILRGKNLFSSNKLFVLYVTCLQRKKFGLSSLETAAETWLSPAKEKFTKSELPFFSSASRASKCCCLHLHKIYGQIPSTTSSSCSALTLYAIFVSAEFVSRTLRALIMDHLRRTAPYRAYEVRKFSTRYQYWGVRYAHERL